MTKLEELNRRMLELEHNGDISEAEYAAYKKLLEAVDLLKDLRNSLSQYDDGDWYLHDDATSTLDRVDDFFAGRDSQSKGLPQRETVEAAGNPDSEHLDWLEAHPEFLLRKHKGCWFCAPFTNYPYNSYSTLREALRAAVEGTWNK